MDLFIIVPNSSILFFTPLPMWDTNSFMYGISAGVLGILLCQWLFSLLQHMIHFYRTSGIVLVHVFPPNRVVQPIECLICLEPITNRESLIECSSCKQAISHVPCMIQWMQRSNTCPHCQVEIKYEWTDYTAMIDST